MPDSLMKIILPSLVIILGLLLIAALTSYLNKKQSTKSNRSYSTYSRKQTANWIGRFRYLKFKYLLGYTFLLLALIYQSNPSIITTITTNVFVQPKPPVLNTSYWPWQTNTLHPAVANMPPDVEKKGIQSVAQYIANQEPDPYLRIKALHDYVAERITYDVKAFETGIQPSQEAKDVFKRRTAVCTGYANLLSALGNAVGEKIYLVTGKVRQDLIPVERLPIIFKLTNTMIGHAWNAVKIAGNWYLIDVTWDSGSVENSNQMSSYSTDYLMIPPQIMVTSHFPDIPNWQLLSTPVSYETFEKQPLLEPKFFAKGLQLISPTQYLTDVQKIAKVEIKNPQQHLIGAVYLNEKTKNSSRVKDKEEIQACETQQGITTQISCQFPSSGHYQVLLLSLKNKGYDFLGQVNFNAL